jgi:hypothetical protein
MRYAHIAELEGTFGSKRAREPRIWDAVAKWQLDGLVLEALQATKDDLTYILSRGIRPALTVTPRDAGVSGAPLADWMNDKLIELGYVGSRAKELCDVFFNDESDDYVRLLATLRAFRFHRYLRAMGFSTQPNKAGLFPDPLVNFLNSDIACVVVQETYRGPSSHTQDMDPVDPAFCKLNMIDRGIRSRDRGEAVRWIRTTELREGPVRQQRRSSSVEAAGGVGRDRDSPLGLDNLA